MQDSNLRVQNYEPGALPLRQPAVNVPPVSPAGGYSLPHGLQRRMLLFGERQAMFQPHAQVVDHAAPSSMRV